MAIVPCASVMFGHLNLCELILLLHIPLQLLMLKSKHLQSIVENKIIIILKCKQRKQQTTQIAFHFGDLHFCFLYFSFLILSFFAVFQSKCLLVNQVAPNLVTFIMSKCVSISSRSILNNLFFLFLLVVVVA